MLKTSHKISKIFIDDNFLLQNDLAEKLFHIVAKDLPIIDYHNHVNPVHLNQNRRFENLTELWVQDDPYKHRAMRINGIAENIITGDVSPKDKFLAWTKTFPNTVGNPLYHWTRLELKRIFGIDEMLSEETAEEIWNGCNSRLKDKGFGAKEILKKWKAETICTSDDILDDLTAHKSASDKEVEVKPSLRADAAIAFEINGVIKKIAGQVNKEVQNLDDYKSILVEKIDYFAANGCLLADHALDAGFKFDLPTETKAKQLFENLLKGVKLSKEEMIQLKSHMLVFLGVEYGKRGWIMQLHVGAQRYTSSRLRSLAGPAGGYACIGQSSDINSLCLFLDTLEKMDLLPKTILYTLNPMDNEAFASLTGSFAEDGVKGKIQFGPPWWYNDHAHGIRSHLAVLSNYGLLSHFIGFTTDSRSVLSFSRHEYFRRVLCHEISKWVKEGEIPNDFQLLEQLVKNICYNNIKEWMHI